MKNKATGKHLFKRTLAAVMAAAVVFTAVPQSGLTALAAGKSVTVKTQKQLNAALKNKSVTTITIKGAGSKTLTVKNGSYAKKTLTVNSANVKVNNGGKFKTVNIKDAKTFTEKTKKANSIKVTDSKLTLTVAKSSTGNTTVNIAKKNANVTIKDNGKIKSVTVSKKADVTIKGTSTSEVAITNNAAGSTISTAVDANITLAKAADVTVESGATVSNISASEASTVSVSTGATVESITADASTDVAIASGATVEAIDVVENGATVNVYLDGELDSASVDAAATLNIIGKGENTTPVAITSNAAGATISTAATASITANANTNVTVAAGAEGTTVTESGTANASVTNNSTTAVTVTTTDANGNTTGTETVNAGSSTSGGSDSGNTGGNSGTNGGSSGGSSSGGSSSGGSGSGSGNASGDASGGNASGDASGGDSGSGDKPSDNPGTDEPSEPENNRETVSITAEPTTIATEITLTVTPSTYTGTVDTTTVSVKGIESDADEMVRAVDPTSEAGVYTVTVKALTSGKAYTVTLKGIDKETYKNEETSVQGAVTWQDENKTAIELTADKIAVKYDTNQKTLILTMAELTGSTDVKLDGNNVVTLNTYNSATSQYDATTAASKISTGEHILTITGTNYNDFSLKFNYNPTYTIATPSATEENVPLADADSFAAEDLTVSGYGIEEGNSSKKATVTYYKDSYVDAETSSANKLSAVADAQSYLKEEAGKVIIAVYTYEDAYTKVKAEEKTITYTSIANTKVSEAKLTLDGETEVEAAQVGDTLTAVTNGVGGVTYQWMIDGANEGSAGTTATFKLTEAMVTKKITVKISNTNGGSVSTSDEVLVEKGDLSASPSTVSLSANVEYGTALSSINIANEIVGDALKIVNQAGGDVEGKASNPWEWVTSSDTEVHEDMTAKVKFTAKTTNAYNNDGVIELPVAITVTQPKPTQANFTAVASDTVVGQVDLTYTPTGAESGYVPQYAASTENQAPTDDSAWTDMEKSETTYKKAVSNVTEDTYFFVRFKARTDRAASESVVTTSTAPVKGKAASNFSFASAEVTEEYNEAKKYTQTVAETKAENVVAKYTIAAEEGSDITGTSINATSGEVTYAKPGVYKITAQPDDSTKANFIGTAEYTLTVTIGKPVVTIETTSIGVANFTADTDIEISVTDKEGEDLSGKGDVTYKFKAADGTDWEDFDAEKHAEAGTYDVQVTWTPKTASANLYETTVKTGTLKVTDATLTSEFTPSATVNAKYTDTLSVEVPKINLAVRGEAQTDETATVASVSAVNSKGATVTLTLTPVEDKKVNSAAGAYTLSGFTAADTYTVTVNFASDEFTISPATLTVVVAAGEQAAPATAPTIADGSTKEALALSITLPDDVATVAQAKTIEYAVLEQSGNSVPNDSAWSEASWTAWPLSTTSKDTENLKTGERTISYTTSIAAGKKYIAAIRYVAIDGEYAESPATPAAAAVTISGLPNTITVKNGDTPITFESDKATLTISEDVLATTLTALTAEATSGQDVSETWTVPTLDNNTGALDNDIPVAAGTYICTYASAASGGYPDATSQELTLVVTPSLTLFVSTEDEYDGLGYADAFGAYATAVTASGEAGAEITYEKTSVEDGVVTYKYNLGGEKLTKETDKQGFGSSGYYLPIAFKIANAAYTAHNKKMIITYGKNKAGTQEASADGDSMYTYYSGISTKNPVRTEIKQYEDGDKDAYGMIYKRLQDVTEAGSHPQGEMTFAISFDWNGDGNVDTVLLLEWTADNLEEDDP